ncbi:MAG: hypothetical protein L0G99_09145 [Propionibacteriales bacterium]|nr:hypothetical protein [Propionibacteriales bacterium]
MVQRERTRLKLYGRYDAMVDADLARTHLRELMAGGMGWKRVARAAGLTGSTVYPILYGRGGTDPRPPRKQVTRAVHEAIMAVQLDLAPGALVDAIGTQRRLQALMAIGWTGQRLADRLGLTVANFHTMVQANQVIKRTADAVVVLYDELWDQTPTPTTGSEAGAIKRSQRRAKIAGWAPPIAWDDELIDDPVAQPSGHMQGPGRRTLPRAVLLEDVEWLLSQGEGSAAIPARLGVAASTIEKACHRAGRHDLARRFRTSSPAHARSQCSDPAMGRAS